jgi:hypothetical protein
MSSDTFEYEIEVTPDMIEAGARALVWTDFEGDAYRVIREILAAIADMGAPLEVRQRRSSTEPELVANCRLSVVTLDKLFPDRAQI